MAKKLNFLPVLFLLLSLAIAGCVTTSQVSKTSIDILSASPDNRIAISSVPFYLEEKTELIQTQPDDYFASLIVCTLETYLQEKGHAAFFIGRSKGLLTKAEIDFIPKISSLVISKYDTNQKELFNPAEANTLSFKNVSKILIPVFVYKKGDALTRILVQPGSMDVTFYAFLVDSHTGNIIWSNNIKKSGNYKGIDLELKGFRWGHGAMWELLKTLPDSNVTAP